MTNLQDLPPVDEVPPVDENAIAIIGMAGRFPGACTLDQFWQNLRDGVESIRFFAKEELLAQGHDPTEINHPNYVPANGMLADVDRFDAAFFGYTPREAELLDPQQRLFLECAVETLESAGYGAQAYRGTVGVFAGMTTSTYLLNNLLPNHDLLASVGLFQAMSNNDKDFLATRLAYKLNLHGPAFTVQTACSTSLVAIHLACQSLHEGECELALAGGVSISIPQVTGYQYEPGMIFSPDGHCRAFDANAQGTLAGSGVGLLLLKRLDDALTAGDTIHAVIKGTAINNDGARKVGYTAPSVEGQAHVIGDALAVAGVPADEIDYIEAHGTATPLGDPIEIRALTRAFREETDRVGYCAIGALKSNVGHMDAAAGVGGVIKTVLALRHQAIPPSLHYTTPNPNIDFAGSPFYVNTTLTPWHSNGHPRRAGVSSFGIGGTNAHVVLEETPVVSNQWAVGSGHASEDKTSSVRLWQLLTLSAKSATALERATDNLAAHLSQNPDLNLADVAYTLQVGREAYNHRRVLVCQDGAEARQLLAAGDPKHLFTGISREATHAVAFLFPGNGTQYIGMGRELYQREPAFRAIIDQCVELLQPHLGVDLRSLLYNADGSKAADKQLQRPAIAMPALFMTEYALAQLWMTWGIQPDIMLGHSLGEYVAACLADVFSLEDALALVTVRGQLFEQLPTGAMLAVSLSATALQPLLSSNLSIAAVNAPELCTVSGTVTAIDEFAQRLAAIGIDHHRLHTDAAFHSPLVEPILAPFHQFVATRKLLPPTSPVISNLTGAPLTASEATSPDYWVRHLRQTVRFADGMQSLLQDPDLLLLEVGPGRTLASLARQHPAYQQQPILTSLRHPHEEQSDSAFLLTTLGKLWLAGVAVDWQGVQAGHNLRRVALPTYPFERNRYWIEPGQSSVASGQSAAVGTQAIADWVYTPSWTQAPRVAAASAAPQRWLIFADAAGWAEAVAQQLIAAGDDVVIVTQCETFVATGDRHYQLNPQVLADFDAFAEQLTTTAGAPTAILYAWSMTLPTNRAPVGERVAQAQMIGLTGLLYLTQLLDQQGWTSDRTITLLTNSLYDITGGEELKPEQALVQGWLTTMPYEYPQLAVRQIDLAVTGHEVEPHLVEQLIRELRSSVTDALVAYRGNHRWVQTFTPLPLPARDDVPLLRQHGTYLITGGLGGVGLELADYLATEVAAQLILTGRATCPARDQWTAWVATHDANDPITRKIQRLQQLEAAGAQVMIAQADVTDAAAMGTVLAQAEATFGPIHGVIHAAGLPGGKVMLRQTPTAIAQTLAPKVMGTLVLDEIFQQKALDFIVYCSALSTVVGAFGHLDYTAANAFLDAMAHAQQRRTDRRTLSINWGRWHQTGMAVAVEAEHMALTGETLDGMSVAQGQALFMRILAQPTPPQLAIAMQPIATLQQQIRTSLIGQVASQALTSNSVASSVTPSTAYARPAISTSYVAPQNATERALAELYQSLLGIEAVGIHDDFFELGGHSLLGTRLIGAVRERFGLEIGLRTLFANPTVAGLAAEIATRQLVQAMQMPAQHGIEQNGPQDRAEHGREHEPFNGKRAKMEMGKL